MASNILGTNYDFTYVGEISSGIFMEDALLNPDLRSVFRVDGNIKSKKQLSILGRSGKAMKGKQLCGTQNVTGTINNIYNRTLEVKPLQMELKQCDDVFRDTVVELLIGAGFEENDLTNTTLFQEVVIKYVMDWAAEEMFRVLSFGDETNPPAGAADYYNMLNGLWPTLIAGVATYQTTAVNDGITTLNQTAGTRAVDYFGNLKNNAPIKLKQRLRESVYLVTGNVYENYIDYLQAQTLDPSFEYLQNGVQFVRYNGRPVIPVYAWDEWISTDGLGNNTRILYTVPNNHVLGLGDGDAWDRLNVWYDMDTKENKMRLQLRAGYQFVLPDLSAISYGNVA